jgi:acyl-CoA reductase-like NAD-dependent aldehyde dehydrogenase
VIECAHLIDGEWIAEGERFESFASYDGSPVGRAPIADAAMVDRAVTAARRAFRESDWTTRRAADRGAVLLELANRLERIIPEISELSTREMGKPIRLMRDREMKGAVDKFRYFAGAGRLLDGTVTGASPANVLDMTVTQPIGVCALIIPWNDPVDLAVRKIGAAMAAGCTMVVKTSEETPASTEALFRLLDDLPGLPNGVVNMIHGPGDPTGEALISHPGIDKISFTGSTPTGKRIAEVAAKRLTRVSLECGGKAPCLVFDDCYKEKCMDALAYGAFIYGGQSCTAATRIIVEDRFYDEFVAGLIARAEKMPAGDPLDEGTLLAPLVSDRQAARVQAFLDTVERDGGRFLLGGTLDGRYCPPTIVADLEPDAEVACTEVFGPVVTVFRARDEEHALAIANSTRYGLGGSVWTSDITRALRLTKRLEFGDIWINTHYIRQSETPFGGWKESGIGRELGLAGMREYLSNKRIAIDTADDFHLRTWFENPPKA